jgi:hypothetical protein
VRAAVLATVRDLMRGDLHRGAFDFRFRFRIDAEDADGTID